MTSLPSDLDGIDPAGADPALAGAPLSVRKASAWLEAQKPFRTRRMFAMFAVFAMPFAGLAAAAAVASATGSEPLGLIPLALGFGAMGIGAWRVGKSWGKTQAWAQNLVRRWHILQELGVPAHVAPDPGVTALDRMADRVGALAGPDRADVSEAVHRAAARARRLEVELGHLTRSQTGQPDADAALDAARERLVAEIARTRAHVAEVYAALLELEASPSHESAELETAVATLAAELEVDVRSVAARASAARRTTR